MWGVQLSEFLVGIRVTVQGFVLGVCVEASFFRLFHKKQSGLRCSGIRVIGFKELSFCRRSMTSYP